MTAIDISFRFAYPYTEFPQDVVVYFHPRYLEKAPFVSMIWGTPDGRAFALKNATAGDNDTYRFTESTPVMGILAENPEWRTWFVAGGDYPTPAFYVLFAAPESDQAAALKGTYTLLIKGLVFETGSDLEAELVVFGQVHGAAGTDFMRRDLVVPLLWGLPFALAIGLFGAVTTTLFSLLVAAASAWLGGWVDALIQRIIEANIILPVLAIAVLFYSFYRIDIWFVLVFVVLLSGFGSPTKAFRAAFLQVKEAPYIEAARAYGVGNWRMIRHYMVPRILPMVIPSVVNLIPNFVFLEATLAIFGVSDPRYPTWGRILYSALRYGASYGSRYWVLEPIILLLITGLAFVLVGRALNHVLNPRLSIE
jgi:peptide/nickel transport system permease protein